MLACKLFLILPLHRSLYERVRNLKVNGAPKTARLAGIPPPPLVAARRKKSCLPGRGEGGGIEPGQRNGSTCIHACMFVCLYACLSVCFSSSHATSRYERCTQPNDYSFQKCIAAFFPQQLLTQSLAPSKCIHACLQACLQACLLSQSNPPEVLRRVYFYPLNLRTRRVVLDIYTQFSVCSDTRSRCINQNAGHRRQG